MRLLDLMDAEPDIELRYGFHRILALISGPGLGPGGRPHPAARAARGIGRVLRDPSVCFLDRELPPPARSRPSSAGSSSDELVRMTTARKRGPRALCASGGGITGLYFEMGALKCLVRLPPAGSPERLRHVLRDQRRGGPDRDPRQRILDGRVHGRDRGARRASGSRRSSLSLLKVSHLNLGEPRDAVRERPAGLRHDGGATS